jgi:hypothetical protein
MNFKIMLRDVTPYYLIDWHVRNFSFSQRYYENYCLLGCDTTLHFGGMYCLLLQGGRISLFNLKMEATYFFKMLEMIYQTTWHENVIPHADEFSCFCHFL